MRPMRTTKIKKNMIKYYTDKDIKQILTPELVKEFYKFMRGQACYLLENKCKSCYQGKTYAGRNAEHLTNDCNNCNGKGTTNESGYYKHDVDRFLNRHGIKPLEGRDYE